MLQTLFTFNRCLYLKRTLQQDGGEHLNFTLLFLRCRYFTCGRIINLKFLVRAYLSYNYTIYYKQTCAAYSIVKLKSPLCIFFKIYLLGIFCSYQSESRHRARLSVSIDIKQESSSTTRNGVSIIDAFPNKRLAIRFEFSA